MRIVNDCELADLLVDSLWYLSFDWLAKEQWYCNINIQHGGTAIWRFYGTSMLSAVSEVQSIISTERVEQELHKLCKHNQDRLLLDKCNGKFSTWFFTREIVRE